MWKNWNQLDPGSRLFINGLDFSDRPWWGPIYGSPFEFPFPGRGRNGMMLRPSIHTGGLPGSSLGRRPGPCGPSSGHSGQRGFTWWLKVSVSSRWTWTNSWMMQGVQSWFVALEHRPRSLIMANLNLRVLNSEAVTITKWAWTMIENSNAEPCHGCLSQELFTINWSLLLLCFSLLSFKNYQPKKHIRDQELDLPIQGPWTNALSHGEKRSLEGSNLQKKPIQQVDHVLSSSISRSQPD